MNTLEPLLSIAIELMDICEADCLLKNTENHMTFHFSRKKDNQLCLFKKTHNKNSNNVIFFELLDGNCLIFYACESDTCGQEKKVLELRRFEIDTKIIDSFQSDQLLFKTYLYEVKDKYNSTFNFKRDFFRGISKYCDVITFE